MMLAFRCARRLQLRKWVTILAGKCRSSLPARSLLHAGSRAFHHSKQADECGEPREARPHHQRDGRAPSRVEAERHRDERRAERLTEQARRWPSSARAAAAGSRGAEVIIARLFGALKMPKPRPHKAMRQIASNPAGRPGIAASSGEAGRHQGEADAAQMPAGKRSDSRPAVGADHGDRQRPRRHQQPALRLASARACPRRRTAGTQGQPLRAEGGRSRPHRKREQRNPQQIDRQSGEAASTGATPGTRRSRPRRQVLSTTHRPTAPMPDAVDAIISSPNINALSAALGQVERATPAGVRRQRPQAATSARRPSEH